MLKLPLLTDAELARVREEYPLTKGCPTCRGAGEYKLYGVTVTCDCPTQIRLAKAYYNANIGSRFQVLGWDDFQSGDKDFLVPAFKEYVENFEFRARYGMGLTLSGDLGSGKTMLICCVLKDLIKQGKSCYFIQVKDIIDAWSTRDKDATSKQLEQRLKRVDLLALDELYTGLTTQYKTYISETLECVVRHRYNNSLPTLITTNLSIDDQSKEYPRIFSLMSATNDWFTAKDRIDARSHYYRQRIHELAMNQEVLPIV